MFVSDLIKSPVFSKLQVSTVTGAWTRNKCDVWQYCSTPMKLWAAFWNAFGTLHRSLYFRNNNTPGTGTVCQAIFMQQLMNKQKHFVCPYLLFTRIPELKAIWLIRVHTFIFKTLFLVIAYKSFQLVVNYDLYKIRKFLFSMILSKDVLVESHLDNRILTYFSAQVCIRIFRTAF